MASRKGVHEQVSDEQDSEEEPPEPDETWLDRRQTAVTLNMSLATVRRLEKEGYLKPVPMPGTRGAKVVYDPEQVRELVGTVQAESASSDEMNAQTLVASSVALSKQSGAHAERLLQLVEEPAHTLLAMLKGENENLRARVRELEVERTDHFKMMEEMRGQAHERELETLRWAATNERKDSILKLIIDNGPKLTQQIVTSGQGPQLLESLTGLANSLSANQVTSLMQILDENQALQLGKVLEAAKKKDDEKKSEPDQPHALLKD